MWRRWVGVNIFICTRIFIDADVRFVDDVISSSAVLEQEHAILRIRHPEQHRHGRTVVQLYSLGEQCERHDDVQHSERAELGEVQ